MKLITTMLISLFTLSLQAKECQYSLSPNDLKVEWVAYKTPSKAGSQRAVHGAGH